MSTATDFKAAFDVASAVLPAVGELVAALIAMGKSHDEAVELVKRDITSRREQYEREKAEDERALEDKEYDE